MSALDHDPLACVRDALERNGYPPRGSAHDFRSACPGHDGTNPQALHVSTGCDGRALLYCFTGCDAENVVRALGLGWADLFPPGHHHARPLRGVGRAVPFIDLALQALRELGIDYHCTARVGFWAADECPACRRADRWPLWITEDDRGRVTLSCAGGCEQISLLRALAGTATTTNEEDT